jgi:hypothetical protein
MRISARGAVLAPVIFAAYGAVVIGLAWVTLVEAGSSARRLIGWAPKTRDRVPQLGNPVQTL